MFSITTISKPGSSSSPTKEMGCGLPLQWQQQPRSIQTCCDDISRYERKLHRKEEEEEEEEVVVEVSMEDVIRHLFGVSLTKESTVDYVLYL
jgi:hypothetical protein